MIPSYLQYHKVLSFLYSLITYIEIKNQMTDLLFVYKLKQFLIVFSDRNLQLQFKFEHKLHYFTIHG